MLSRANSRVLSKPRLHVKVKQTTLDWWTSLGESLKNKSRSYFTLKKKNLDFVLYGPFYIIGMSELVTSWKKCVSKILILYFQQFYGIYLICLSDEMLNQGPDSLWSFKIPWHFSLRVGCNPGVLAKFPPLALVNHGLLIIPIHLIVSMTLSPLHL